MNTWNICVGLKAWERLKYNGWEIDGENMIVELFEFTLINLFFSAILVTALFIVKWFKGE